MRGFHGVRETSLASDPAIGRQPIGRHPIELQLEDERRLVEEARRGNLDAMKPIFEHYATPLFASVIMPRLGDRAAAEDVLRDTLMTAVEKLDKFQWQGKSIYFWLRQIAVNKVYDVHRRSQRTRKLVDAMAVEMPVATAHESRADMRLIAAEEERVNRARIEDAMGRLSVRYQTAIRLRLIEELSREECAARMDITVGNFDVLLFRAVRAFRKRFGERHRA